MESTLHFLVRRAHPAYILRPGARRRHRLLLRDPYEELVELFLIDDRRRVRHQVSPLLCLGESYDVADGVGRRHYGEHPVEAEGYSAVRGRAELQGVEEVAEPCVGLLA